MSASTLNNDRMVVFGYFMAMGRTGSVKITINPEVNGMIKNDAIMVHDAPPRVVSEILGEFHMVSLTNGGLLIPVTESK